MEYRHNGSAWVANPDARARRLEELGLDANGSPRREPPALCYCPDNGVTFLVARPSALVAKGYILPAHTSGISSWPPFPPDGHPRYVTTRVAGHHLDLEGWTYIPIPTALATAANAALAGANLLPAPPPPLRATPTITNKQPAPAPITPLTGAELTALQWEKEIAAARAEEELWRLRTGWYERKAAEQAGLLPEQPDGLLGKDLERWLEKRDALLDWQQEKKEAAAAAEAAIETATLAPEADIYLPEPPDSVVARVMQARRNRKRRPKQP